MAEVFVPNGEDRRETAVLLVGTADEHDIDQRSIRTTPNGFYIPEELADLLAESLTYDEDYEDYDPDAADEPGDEDEDEFLASDYNVEQVKEFVTENPETAADVLRSEQAGKNRTSLVSWLTDTINAANAEAADNETSGDRAEENKAQDKE